MALIQCNIDAAARVASVRIEYIYPGWPPIILDALTGASTTSQDAAYPLLDVVTVLEIVSADAFGGGRGPENRVARFGEQRTNLLRGYTNALIRLVNLMTENFLDRDGVQVGKLAASTTYMRGPLDVGGFKIQDMAAGTDDQDLVTFAQFKVVQFDYEDRRDEADQATLRLDSAIAMAGNLDMGVTLPGQRVINLSAPTLSDNLITFTYFNTAILAFITGYLVRTGVFAMENAGAPWDMAQHGINDMSDPISSSDAVSKNYFDVQTSAGTTSSVPIGAVMPHMGSSIPPGFLLCDGREVSRTTYSALFAVLGIAYGTPSGGSVFVLPDLRGRAIIGLDNMGGIVAGRVVASWASTLGGTGGEEAHTISTGELPSHTHDLTDSYFASGSGGALSGQTSPATDASTFATTGAVTDSAGTGIAHNNLQPSMTTAWIIRAGV